MKRVLSQSSKQSSAPASGPPAGGERRQLAYLSHPSSLLHDMGEGHPECPARVSAVRNALREAGLMDEMDCLEAPAATYAQMLRAHPSAHLRRLEHASPASGTAHLDGDTSMNEHSLTAAIHAAGAMVHAVELVTGGGYQRAFCNVRPPGHHAESSTPMGFCLINSVAVGAMHALEARGLERVAIIDFDVHHGNGTEEILAAEPRVMMASTFQSPLYPGSGETPLGPNMVNVGLPPGSDGQALRRAVEDQWWPALTEFKPQLLLISAGFDAHQDDPLAQLNWTEQDYAWVTHKLSALANMYCEGRIVSTLEGGYALPALGRSAVAHVRALIGH